MTEEKQHSTSPYEDEISLTDLLEVLIKKKVLILAVTFIFTLLSIFYAQLKIPTYKATIGFLEPQETFLSALPPEIAKRLPGYNDNSKNKTSKMSTTNPSPFSMFLSKVTTYKSKKDTLEKGNLLKRFYGEDNIANMENVILNIHNSSSLTREKEDENLPNFNRPVYLEVTGTKPEVMAVFLNTLAQSATQDVTKEIKDLISLVVDTEVLKITREIDILRSVAEEQVFNDRVLFSDALSIARNLGIKNNNFDKLKKSGINIGVSSQTRTSLDLSSAESLENFLESQEKTTITIQDTTLPLWYLYGEKALLQELDTIKFGKKYELQVSGINLKNISLKKYSSIDISSLEIKVATISQPSIPPTIPLEPNKAIIIAIGMGFGLFIGFIMAFLSNLIDQLKKKQPSNTNS